MAENSGRAAARPRGRGRPFERGRSGNPGGRPAVARELVELARDHGPEAVGVLVALMRRGPATVRVRAAVELLDRGYGRPRQALEVGGGVEAVTFTLQLDDARERVPAVEDAGERPALRFAHLSEPGPGQGTGRGQWAGSA